MNHASLCPCFDEIIVIGICEFCGHVDSLQTGAEPARALLEAVESQVVAQGWTAWIRGGERDRPGLPPHAGAGRRLRHREEA